MTDEAAKSLSTSSALVSSATQKDRESGAFKLTKKRFAAERAKTVTAVVDQILDEVPLLVDFVTSSKLHLIAQRELDRDLELQRSKGYLWTSPRVRWRMRKAIFRHFDKERNLRGDNGSRAGREKTLIEGYRARVLVTEECNPPQLSQEALLRISKFHARAVDRFGQCIASYNQDIEADLGLTRGLPPATRIRQIFGSFAKALAEAQAIEYWAITGCAGADRWRKMVCESVFSEISQTTPLVGGCFAICDGREDLIAVIEATVECVIEDRALPNGALPGWREDASRKAKVQWFKVRNRIGKQNISIYQAAGVDRKSWSEWVTEQLPSSSSRSKRIEALLRSGKLPNKKQL